MARVTEGAAVGGSTAALVMALLVSVRVVVRRRRAGRVVRRLGVETAPAPGTRTAPSTPPVPTLRAPAPIGALLDDAGIAEHDRVVTAAVAGLAGAALVGGAAGGPALAVVLPLVTAAGVAGTVVALRGRGDRRYAAALPLALELVARGLRSGASLAQAIEEAAAATPGPVGVDLAAVAAGPGLGRPLAAGVEAWAQVRPLPGVRLAAAALALGIRAGGPQARAIDGVAATVREQLALEREVRALTSQARTSALVIAVAPLAFCALTVATDADSARFLLRTPTGLALLTAGLALDGLAAAWMHRLTSRVAA